MAVYTVPPSCRLGAALMREGQVGLIEIALIAGGLAMDAFAVSLAAGAAGARGPRAVFRLSFHFGLFQFLMPVLGWTAGLRVAGVVLTVEDFVAAGLLAAVGLRMIRSAQGKDVGPSRDPSRGVTLVTLSIATSLDALAIGFSLALLRVSIWYPSVVIGAVTGLLSVCGVRLGNRLGAGFGRRMEIAGGVLLTFLGCRILLSHFFA
ncbi:MAG TPA: manganese efflux pump MntP family protein [Candidatus Acidoferrum sp.]|nr:manganese efflux pump MntP family protein [Candidatus Acidoferrum sp.]